MKKLYFLLFTILISVASFGQVVISQAYGGGGNSGSTYKNDFIELFNRGTSSVSLNGWSVQYASSTGSSWTVTTLPDFTLAPGQYFLIQQAAGSGGTTDLPTPDVIGTIAMSGTNFKVLLSNSTNAESGTCPTGAQIMDFVGFGSANCSETAAAPVLSNTTAGLRLNGGCGDSNNNSVDFSTGAPTPRNSSSPTSVCSTDPTLSLSSGQANGSSFTGNPEDINASIDFVTTNFTMSTDAGGGTGTGGDGFIKWNVKDAGNSVIDSGNIFTSNDGIEYQINGLNVNNTYTLYAELVDNTGATYTPATNYTITITIPAYIDVANIAELRAGTIDPNTYYRVTGEVINTYSRSNRNQKYFQDATGGILVDDLAFEISSVYNTGDGVTNIRGTLFDFNGTLEFVPSPADWGSATSTGNPVSIPVVTISDLVTGWENYESELVRINGVTFADGNGINTFSSSTNYNISDTNTMFFRTAFFEANYITTTIPSGSNSIVGLVGEISGTPYVVARSLSELTLSTKANLIQDFVMYPNPTSLGYVNITSRSNAKMSVSVYDFLGKQVINETVSDNRLSVSKLNAGVYIMKVSQEDATITKKLVIK